jgi:hypothetical protein
MTPTTQDAGLIERARDRVARRWEVWAETLALADRLEALSQAATAEPEGWRPIESAPTDGRNVLVFCPRASDHGYNRIRLTWRKDGKWQGANNTLWPPTHWMPPGCPFPPPQPWKRDDQGGDM